MAALTCAALSVSQGAYAGQCPVASRQEKAFELSSYSMEEIIPLLPLLQQWVVREFRQYPYLWAPANGEICEGNTMLLNEPKAQVVVVKDQGRVVGVAAGIPLDSFAMIGYLGGRPCALMEEKGFDISRIFYMSYFLTDPEYRNNQQLVDLIYNDFVDFAYSVGKTQICYFEDCGNPESPLKPQNPIPIEPWGVLIHGFKSTGIKVGIAWQTLQPDGSSQEQAHTSEFFIKDL